MSTLRGIGGPVLDVDGHGAVHAGTRPCRPCGWAPFPPLEEVLQAPPALQPLQGQPAHL